MSFDLLEAGAGEQFWTDVIRTVALGADVSEAAVAVVELAPRPLLDGGGTDALIDLTFSDARDPLVARKKYLRFSFNLENDLEAIFGLEDFEQVYCRPIVQSVNKTSISMPVLRFQRAVNRMVNVIRLATPLRPAPPTAAAPPSGLAAGGVRSMFETSSDDDDESEAARLARPSPLAMPEGVSPASAGTAARLAALRARSAVARGHSMPEPPSGARRDILRFSDSD